ncbi:MAG: hypothetical protein J7647_22110 [Cyanobacteria bacterium SBLK]|nr:hypothetical protein [Cyanobacteria bacterium SBLK]
MKIGSLVLTAFGLCLSGLFLATLTRAQTVQPSNNDNTNAYPASERRAFINSCASGQSSTFQVVCGCTFDKIKANIPYSQYQEIARKLREGEELPQNILTFINECLNAPE